MEKKQWLMGACLIFGLLIVNLFLPNWNRGIVYWATDLPSEFCVEQEPRVAENLEKTGCLTFGPYREQEAGKIQVTVVYDTDTEGNWVDIYSDTLKETFQKAGFDPARNEITLEAEIGEDVTDLEIRSHYEGNGYLQIEKIIVTERMEDLQMVIWIYNLIFLGGLIGWILWKNNLFGIKGNLKIGNKYLKSKKEWKQMGIFDKLLFIMFIWMFICISLFIFRGANITFNSDCAAVNLLAREQRVTKQFLPSTWNYSTDLMVWFLNIPIAFFQLFMTNEFFMRSIAVFIFVIIAIYSICICMEYTFKSRCYLIACIWIFTSCSQTFRDMLIEQAAYIVAIINSFLCFYFFISSVDEEFKICDRKRFALLLIFNFMQGCFSITIVQQVVLPLIGAIVIMTWYKNENTIIWKIDNIKEKIKTILFLLLVSGVAFAFYSMIKRNMDYSGNAEQLLKMKNVVEIVERFPVFISGILAALGIGGKEAILSLQGMKGILHIFLGLLLFICPILLLLKFKKEEFKVQFFMIYAYIHMIEVCIILIFGHTVDYIGVARYMLSSICFMMVISSYFIYKYVIRNNNIWNITNIAVGIIILLFVFFNTEDKIRFSVLEYDKEYQSKYGIINFLKEKDLFYGYASFWHAGVYTVASDFEVEVNPVNFHSKPEAYYWLTSDRGFKEENYIGRTFLMMTQKEYQDCLIDKYCYPILGEPEEILEYGSYVIQTYPYNICTNDFGGIGNFSALSLMKYSGGELKKENENVIIELGQVLYGPYITLKDGLYIIEIDADLNENVDLLITDSCGKNILFRFTLQDGLNQFEFVLEEEKKEVEFNITNTSNSEIIVKEIKMLR